MDRSASPSPTFLATYAGWFIVRLDVVLTAGRGSSWHWERRELSHAILADALAGRTFLGLPAVATAGRSRWICLDVDDDRQVPSLARVVQLLDDPLGALLEPSRRGAHLWLFIEPVPWQQAQAWGLELAQRAGLSRVEVFPKSGD